MTKDTKLWFDCTLGKKSHLNIFGKIVFSPLILFTGLIWIVLDLLFAKKIKDKR